MQDLVLLFRNSTGIKRYTALLQDLTNAEEDLIHTGENGRMQEGLLKKRKIRKKSPGELANCSPHALHKES